jgi:hypothetical protein
MNEASNFCDGSCYPDEKVFDSIAHKLKYTPTNRDLEKKAISLDAYHANGLQ